jgi:hypothetical protein
MFTCQGKSGAHGGDQRTTGPCGRRDPGAAGRSAGPVHPLQEEREGRPGRAGRRIRPDLARGLPLRHEAAPGPVREDQAAVADRDAEAAAVDPGPAGPARHPVRGPGRGRQGRHDQAVHREPEPPWRARDRPGQADRARADRVVPAALHLAPARSGRDRDVRPVLVQPGRRRAGDGVLPAGRGHGVLARGARVRADAGPGRDHPGQVLVLGIQGRAAAPVRPPPARSGQALEAEPDRPGLTGQMGRVHQGQGVDVLLHRPGRRALDRGEEQRQEACPARGDAVRPVPGPLRGPGRAGGRPPRPADRRPRAAAARERRAQFNGRPARSRAPVLAPFLAPFLAASPAPCLALSRARSPVPSRAPPDRPRGRRRRSRACWPPRHRPW